MRHLARIVAHPCLPVLAACLLVLAPSRAASPSPTPTPIPTLKLNDGRVLHNVVVKSNEPDSIVVRASEGLLKVAKSNLPQDLADAFPAKSDQPGAQDMVMQPFNPNAPQAAPGQPPLGRPIPRPTPTPKPTRDPTYKGCTIVSFQPKAFQTSLGCAEVVIRNDTDTPVLINPGEIVCVTTTGGRRNGRIFVTDGVPPIIKRIEIVPARGDVDDILTFTNDALDISYVEWAR
ncbi:MAG TPA: hypothetical protein VN775_02795 [Opitutaceae bacterium]|nr:hypothetical protein [Opitutaceae bacterium]